MLPAYLFKIFTLKSGRDFESDIRLVQVFQAPDIACQEATA